MLLQHRDAVSLPLLHRGDIPHEEVQISAVKMMIPGPSQEGVDPGDKCTLPLPRTFSEQSGSLYFWGRLMDREQGTHLLSEWEGIPVYVTQGVQLSHTRVSCASWDILEAEQRLTVSVHIHTRSTHSLECTFIHREQSGVTARIFIRNFWCT